MPEFRLSWKTDFEILIHVNRSLGVSCSHKKGVILVKTAAFCEGKCLERELAINCQQPTLWSLKNKDHSLEGWSDWHVMTSFLVSLRFGLFSIRSLTFPECPPGLVLTQSQLCPWFLHCCHNYMGSPTSPHKCHEPQGHNICQEYRRGFLSCSTPTQNMSSTN